MSDAPAPFPGSDDEIAANRATHDFDPQWQRCTWCDCRPWGRIAQWPCGAEPPRIPDDGSYVHTFIAGASLHAEIDRALGLGEP